AVRCVYIEAEDHTTCDLQQCSKGARQFALLPATYPDECSAFNRPSGSTPTSVERQRHCEGQEQHPEGHERLDEQPVRWGPASMQPGCDCQVQSTHRERAVGELERAVMKHCRLQSECDYRRSKHQRAIDIPT